MGLRSARARATFTFWTRHDHEPLQGSAARASLLSSVMHATIASGGRRASLAKRDDGRARCVPTCCVRESMGRLHHASQSHGTTPVPHLSAGSQRTEPATGPFKDCRSRSPGRSDPRTGTSARCAGHGTVARALSGIIETGRVAAVGLGCTWHPSSEAARHLHAVTEALTSAHTPS
jgi:hypothetical protein